MFMQFFFSFRQRFHLVDKLTTAREFDVHVRHACTILMTKYTSLYTVPYVHVQSEVYFGLDLRTYLACDLKKSTNACMRSNVYLCCYRL